MSQDLVRFVVKGVKQIKPSRSRDGGPSRQPYTGVFGWYEDNPWVDAQEGCRFRGQGTEMVEAEWDAFGWFPKVSSESVLVVYGLRFEQRGVGQRARSVLVGAEYLEELVVSSSEERPQPILRKAQ